MTNHPPRRWDSGDPESGRYITSVLWGIDIQPPAIVTLQDVVNAGMKYHERAKACKAACTAYLEALKGLTPDCSDEAWQAYFSNRLKTEAALTEAEKAEGEARNELRRMIAEHAVGDVHTVRGIVDGQAVRVRYTPGAGVQVWVGDEVTGDNVDVQ